MNESRMRVLSLLAFYPSLTVYDIASKLNLDYGNTSRCVRDHLLKDNYVIECDRVQLKGRVKKIYYKLSEKGFVYHLAYYLENNNLPLQHFKTKTITKNQREIINLFRNYPDIFPKLTENIKELIQSEFFKLEDEDIVFYSLYRACNVYKKELSVQDAFMKDDSGNNLDSDEIDCEKDIIQFLQRPLDYTLKELFFNEFMRSFIDEPSFKSDALSMPVSLFIGRLSDITAYSHDLEELIFSWLKDQHKRYLAIAEYYSNIFNSQQMDYKNWSPSELNQYKKWKETLDKKLWRP